MPTKACQGSQGDPDVDEKTDSKEEENRSNQSESSEDNKKSMKRDKPRNDSPSCCITA